MLGGFRKRGRDGADIDIDDDYANKRVFVFSNLFIICRLKECRKGQKLLNKGRRIWSI